MPRVLTDRELNNVQDLIDSKMWYWNHALGITDTIRRNPRHAEKIRRELELKSGFDTFDIARRVELYMTMEPALRELLDGMLAGPCPRFWKKRFWTAHYATAMSAVLTVKKVKGDDRWPEHVALYALKEMGRVLSELRAEREIPEPCDYGYGVAEYLHNIDPMEPLYFAPLCLLPLTAMKVSDTMIVELMDNPEGIENVIFNAWLKFRIVAWNVSSEEDWWELWFQETRGEVQTEKHSSDSLARLLSSSYFVLQ